MWGAIVVGAPERGGFGSSPGAVGRTGPGNRAPLRPDLSFLMGAVGARGVLAGEDGAAVLALKSDAMASQTDTDAVSSSESGNLAATRAQVTRLCLALEGSRPVHLGESAVLTPSLELGARHDGGDAETGFGADIRAGLELSDSTRGLTGELRARGLLTHEADGLGAQDDGGLHARRLDARIGYGFGVFEDRYTAIPELGLGRGHAGREFRIGWRLAERVSSGLVFELGVQGTRRDAVNDDAPPEHTVGAGLGVRF